MTYRPFSIHFFQILLNNQVEIEDKLDILRILPYLIQERYVQRDDQEVLKNRQDLCTRRSKVGYILHLLFERKKFGVYDILTDAILKCTCQTKLVQKLNIALEEEIELLTRKYPSSKM